jgi:peptidoglycan/LPS O-acetylase OafA/YrhL
VLEGLAGRHGSRSYALFLVHFPVLLGVNAVVQMLGLDGPWTALAALGLACWGANVAARVFFERIEQPAARWDPWRQLLRPKVLAVLPLGLLAGGLFETFRLA